MDPIDDGAVICLVGAPVAAFDGLKDVAAARGVEVRECDAVDVDSAAPAVALCDGGDALVELVERGVRAPILPVEPTRRSTDSSTGPVVDWHGESSALPGVTRRGAVDALESLIRRGGETHRRSTLSVERAGSTKRAAFDVALVTDEPGAIAAFAVEADGDYVADVRADGLVVATPAGSRGYARAAGGPILAPDATDVALVPIGQFEIRRPTWVGTPDGLVLSLKSDGPAATLQCDGRICETVSPGASVRVRSGPPLSIVEPNESSDT